MKRNTAITTEISDFIVNAVLKHRSVLLESTSIRMMHSNKARKDTWQKISEEIFKKYRLHLNPTQLKNHFNNRRRKTMTSDTLERRYHLKTGGGNSPDYEHQVMNCQASDQDVELYNYFASKTAHKGLKNSDTIQLAGESGTASENGEDDILETDEMDMQNIQTPEEDFQHQPSSEEDDEEPNPRNVSFAQLRRLEAKRIKYQTRCFDTWSRLANVQIQGMQQLIELMKVMMNSLVSSGKKAQEVHAADLRVNEYCDPNVEGSVAPE